MSKKNQVPIYECMGDKKGRCSITGIEWILEHHQQREGLKGFSPSDSYWLYLNGIFRKSFMNENEAMFYLEGYIAGKADLQAKLKEDNDG